MTEAIILFWYNYCHDNDVQCFYHGNYIDFKVMLNSQNTKYFISYHKWQTVEAVRGEMRKATRGPISPECLLTSQKHVPTDSRNKNSYMFCNSHLTKPFMYISLFKLVYSQETYGEYWVNRESTEGTWGWQTRSRKEMSIWEVTTSAQTNSMNITISSKWDYYNSK